MTEQNYQRLMDALRHRAGKDGATIKTMHNSGFEGVTQYAVFHTPADGGDGYPLELCDVCAMFGVNPDEYDD